MKSVLLLVMFFALRAGATTYYVAKNGNDGNPGTESQPWLTLKHMQASVYAGDTCWIKAGTYDESTIHFDHVGTAAHPITFLSYDGYNTIIRTPWIIIAPHYYISGFKFVMSASDTLDGAWNCVKFDMQTYKADSCVIRKCLLTCATDYTITGCGILVGHREGVAIESCEAYGWGRYGQSNQGHGIYVQGSHGAVRWCKSHDNIGVGIHEYFEGANEAAISHNEIAYNLCYGGMDGHSGIIIKSDSDLVHDNITYENTGGGLFLYWGGSAGNRLYNNVSCNDNIGFTDGSTGPNKWFNNVVLQQSTGNPVLQINNETDTLDYNCYYPDGGHAFQWGMNEGDFAAYRAATGQDSHGFCQNPLFVDTAAHSFYLQNASPCIDAGDTTTPPGFDMDHIPTPQGAAVDMGAYEYHTFVLDVGVGRIVAPADTVDSVAAITPQAWVKNYGTAAASFSTTLRIGTSYSNTQDVSKLEAGDSVVVSFNTWTAVQRGVHAVRCSTSLAGDTIHANDTLSGSVTVRVSDVGVTAIVAPPGTFSHL
jgi:hypothetical protein